jgi:DNA-binding NtrC family response regulator
MLRNPFLNRAMIRSVDQFFGRRRELQRVMARIGAPVPQSVSIVGERRAGKSSLLWHLAQEEVQARFLEEPERYVSMLLDFQGQQHLDREGFCRVFSQHLREGIGKRLELEEAVDFSGLEAGIEGLERAGLRLVCLLDEFETVTRNPIFGGEFFGFLRSLANAHPVAFVTSSRRELQTLCHTREISESPFFNIFAQVRLGALMEDEAFALISEPSREMGLPLKPYTAKILDLSGRLPFFLQMACSATFECLAEGEDKHPHWDQVEQRFLEEASSHFRYLWEHFETEEREVISALVAGGGHATGRGTRRTLAGDGYVERSEGEDRLFSGCFARYLRDAVPQLRDSPAREQVRLESGDPQGPSVEPFPQGRTPYPSIIGQSRAIRRVFALMQRAADADVTVLLTGETGTGKELVARILHQKSERQEGPFVVVNCGAIAENLQESELFGHCKGAFTDAVADREGLFEAADGGTLFLDEIGETSPATQVKLLRVLQEGEIRRVGENHTRKVDVRLICATNCELEEEVEGGRFRQDLYYRLYVLAIRLPPLRERSTDIALLVRHFLVGEGGEISPDALALLRSYDWPGNIRELENQMVSALAMARGDGIEPEHLWPRLQRVTPVQSEPKGLGYDATLQLKEARDLFERHFLLTRLQEYGWKLEETAGSLGLSRSRLYELIKRHGLKEG